MLNRGRPLPGLKTLRIRQGGVAAQATSSSGRVVALRALDFNGGERSLYMERRPQAVPCPNCRSVRTLHLLDKRLQCLDCQLVTGYPVELPEPRFYCPVCDDGLLDEHGVDGPNRNRTLTCRVCGTKFRRSDQMPAGIGLMLA